MTSIDDMRRLLASRQRQDAVNFVLNQNGVLTPLVVLQNQLTDPDSITVVLGVAPVVPAAKTA